MKLDELIAAGGGPGRMRDAARIAQELLEDHDAKAARADRLGLHRLATNIRARRRAIEQSLLECVQAEGER